MATKKTKFKHYFDDRNPVATNAGSETKIEYELRISEDGTEELVPCGETNLNDYIQSFRDSVDINKILERVALGDTEALNKVNAFYADVTSLQKNMQDMFNMNLRAENLFNQLPAEIREIYSNSYYNFVTKPELIKNYKPRVQAAKDKKVNKETSMDPEQEQKDE